jgi:DNA-binding transcriptional LysR family regulator
MPNSPADLQSLPSVGLPNEMRSQTWHFRHRLGDTEQITLAPVYTVNNGLMVRLATLKGMGFSIVAEGIVRSDLEDGTLVRLLDDYSVDDPDVKVSIVYPGRQYLPAKTRYFIDYALDYLSREFAAKGTRPDETMRAPLQSVMTLQTMQGASATAN